MRQILGLWPAQTGAAGNLKAPKAAVSLLCAPVSNRALTSVCSEKESSIDRNEVSYPKRWGGESHARPFPQSWFMTAMCHLRGQHWKWRWHGLTIAGPSKPSSSFGSSYPLGDRPSRCCRTHLVNRSQSVLCPPCCQGPQWVGTKSAWSCTSTAENKL